jgi:PhnB protein
MDDEPAAKPRKSDCGPAPRSIPFHSGQPMKRKIIPDGYHTITPYLKLPNCAQLLEFLKTAFGATEKFRLLKPDGSLLHAEVLIGDSMVMVHEAPPPWKAKPSTLYLRVEETDATFKQALAAGATTVFEPADIYYGARVACVTDVADNDWWISSPIENLTLEEVQRRAIDMLNSRNPASNPSHELISRKT